MNSDEASMRMIYCRARHSFEIYRSLARQPRRRPEAEIAPVLVKKQRDMGGNWNCIDFCLAGLPTTFEWTAGYESVLCR